MIDNKHHELSDEMIRSFLLGKLTGGHQSQFEEHLLTDDDLAYRVRLAELELCDEYTSTRTGDQELQVIRERFLLTHDRRGALKVSTVLGDHFRSRARAYSVVERIRDSLHINRPF